MKIKKHINHDFFTTTDLNLATTLSIFAPLMSVNKSDPRRVKFLFGKTDFLENLVEKYWRKELKVEPLEFSNQMKALKTRIYASE